MTRGSAAAAEQEFRGMGHFDGIAGAGRQRLVHVGDERGGPEARAIGDGDQAFGQAPRLVHGRHEGAGAHLHVEHQMLEAGGEFLGQDRGGDERDRFHRRRHVADAIEALVGGRQIGGLADDGAARLARHLAEQVEIGLRDIARNGIELVERAAGVAEAAARDHRHVAAAGRQHGRQHQRDIVADAAGRMLVDHRARQIPRQHRAGIAHGERQAHGLLPAHAAEEDRHGEGRHLALRRRCPSVRPAMKSLHLVARQGRAIALPADDLLRQHVRRPLQEAGEQRVMLSAALAPSRLVSSWLGEAPSMPAARLVMTERAATLQAEAPRQDGLGHRRHADRRAADDLEHADFGRRLEGRAGDTSSRRLDAA